MKQLNYNRELVEKCKRGDTSAQCQLYRAYSRAMYNICLRMLNNEMDAEDILQNSFVDVFQNISSFNYQATPGAWIKRIVINNCINFLKKKRLYFSEISDLTNPIDKEDKVIDISMDVEKILSAMESLSTGYRTIFSLYAIEGYDHAEIAQVLEISESTSKSQYHRAKNRIREILTA